MPGAPRIDAQPHGTGTPLSLSLSEQQRHLRERDHQHAGAAVRAAASRGSGLPFPTVFACAARHGVLVSFSFSRTHARARAREPRLTTTSARFFFFFLSFSAGRPGALYCMSKSNPGCLGLVLLGGWQVRSGDLRQVSWYGGSGSLSSELGLRRSVGPLVSSHRPAATATNGQPCPSVTERV